jgi:micrococcal nuclease
MKRFKTWAVNKTMIVLFLLISLNAAALAGCGAGTRQNVPAEIKAILAEYPALEGRQPEAATVKRIVDGDTFETSKGQKVRLVGVNTPEIHGQAQAFGQEASDYAKRELAGRNVLLFKDVSETDRYGRLLRFVFIQGETGLFNERLVREGYARVMTISPDVTFAELFVKSERSARETGRGLWKATAGKSQAGQEEKANPADRADSSAAGCANPKIKGNINSKGTKIYHIPGSAHYGQTEAEAWFCTEEEAVSEGFRKPR